MFYKKGLLQNFAKFTGKNLWNVLKILRTPILKNICE